MASDSRSGHEEPQPPRSPKPAKPHYLGHRDRAREKFNSIGQERLQDYELLELVLHLCIPRVDTKELAKTLMQRFGSFSGVLAASVEQLSEVKGLKENTATNLKIVQAAAQRYARDALIEQPVLSSWSALIDYCRVQMAFEDKEQFRILFLDKKNRLIADEVQQVGTVDHTPVYPREVIKRSLELNATALILVHNHPSGDPTPSNADLQMTKTIIDIAQPMGITVHDHLIIGRNGHLSMKSRKLI